VRSGSWSGPAKPSGGRNSSRMDTWVLVAAAVGFVLIIVLLIGSRRPRSIQAVLDRPPKPVPAKRTGPPVQQSLSGSLSQTPVRTLLVTIHANRETGALTLTRNDQVCSFYFLFGHLFHASCGGIEGEPAVGVVLSWSDGSYAFDPKATLPRTETVTRPIDQLLLSDEAAPPTTGAPRSAESVDWSALRDQMQQLADAGLANRSLKVKQILGAAQPNRESFIQAIDRIANTSILFVDPARLVTLAGHMRRMLDDATG